MRYLASTRLVLRLPSRYFGIKHIQDIALNQRKVDGMNSPSRRHFLFRQDAGVLGGKLSWQNGDDENVGTACARLAGAGKLSQCLHPCGRVSSRIIKLERADAAAGSGGIVTGAHETSACGAAK